MTAPASRRLSKNLPSVALEDLPDATRPPESLALADDLLVGASAIAAFMFGTAKERRRVYWLVENGRLPVFKLGSTICARKSTILRVVAQRERDAGTELGGARAYTKQPA
jgi:hypothetical protein